MNRDRGVPISAFVAGLTIGALALHLMGYRPDRTPAPTHTPPRLSAPSAERLAFENPFPGLRMGSPMQQQMANRAMGQMNELRDLYEQANREIDQFLSGNTVPPVASSSPAMGSALPPPTIPDTGNRSELTPITPSNTLIPTAMRAPIIAYPPLPTRWNHPWR